MADSSEDSRVVARSINSEKEVSRFLTSVRRSSIQTNNEQKPRAVGNKYKNHTGANIKRTWSADCVNVAQMPILARSTNIFHGSSHCYLSLDPGHFSSIINISNSNHSVCNSPNKFKRRSFVSLGDLQDEEDEYSDTERKEKIHRNDGSSRRGHFDKLRNMFEVKDSSFRRPKRSMSQPAMFRQKSTKKDVQMDGKNIPMKRVANFDKRSIFPNKISLSYLDKPSLFENNRKESTSPRLYTRQTPSSECVNDPKGNSHEQATVGEIINMFDSPTIDHDKVGRSFTEANLHNLPPLIIPSRNRYHEGSSYQFSSPLSSSTQLPRLNSSSPAPSPRPIHLSGPKLSTPTVPISSTTQLSSPTFTMGDTAMKNATNIPLSLANSVHNATPLTNTVNSFVQTNQSIPNIPVYPQITPVVQMSNMSDMMNNPAFHLATIRDYLNSMSVSLASLPMANLNMPLVGLCPSTTHQNTNNATNYFATKSSLEHSSPGIHSEGSTFPNGDYSPRKEGNIESISNTPPGSSSDRPPTTSERRRPFLESKNNSSQTDSKCGTTTLKMNDDNEINWNVLPKSPTSIKFLSDAFTNTDTTSGLSLKEEHLPQSSSTEKLKEIICDIAPSSPIVDYPDDDIQTCKNNEQLHDRGSMGSGIIFLESHEKRVAEISLNGQHDLSYLAQTETDFSGHSSTATYSAHPPLRPPLPPPPSPIHQQVVSETLADSCPDLIKSLDLTVVNPKGRHHHSDSAHMGYFLYKGNSRGMEFVHLDHSNCPRFKNLVVNERHAFYNHDEDLYKPKYMFYKGKGIYTAGSRSLIPISYRQHLKSTLDGLSIETDWKTGMQKLQAANDRAPMNFCTHTSSLPDLTRIHNSNYSPPASTNKEMNKAIAMPMHVTLMSPTISSQAHIYEAMSDRQSDVHSSPINNIQSSGIGHGNRSQTDLQGIVFQESVRPSLGDDDKPVYLYNSKGWSALPRSSGKSEPGKCSSSIAMFCTGVEYENDVDYRFANNETFRDPSSVFKNELKCKSTIDRRLNPTNSNKSEKDGHHFNNESMATSFQSKFGMYKCVHASNEITPEITPDYLSFNKSFDFDSGVSVNSKDDEENGGNSLNMDIISDYESRFILQSASQRGNDKTSKKCVIQSSKCAQSIHSMLLGDLDYHPQTSCNKMSCNNLKGNLKIGQPLSTKKNNLSETSFSDVSIDYDENLSLNFDPIVITAGNLDNSDSESVTSGLFKFDRVSKINYSRR